MTTYTVEELRASIVEAARAIASGRAEAQDLLDRYVAHGLAVEVLRPASELHEQGEIAAAVALYRTFLAQGDHVAVPAILRNMSIAMLQLGDLASARRFHIQAVAAGYQDLSGEAAWADFLIQHGQHEEAKQELRTRLLTLPQSAPLRSLLFTMREFSDMDPRPHLADHLAWWSAQPPVRRLSGPPQPFAGRPLRLGVLVRDLRNHASFNRTFDAFPHIHGGEIDVSLVSIRGGAAIRDTLAGLQVHEVSAEDPDVLAEALAALRFDMILDLVSHGNSRVFIALRRRPAPVQMGWISSGITSGVPWIDYMLTDGLISPVGSDRHYSECLVRLPVPSFAVPSLGHAPALVEPPLLRKGHVTFGVFNRVSKITQASLEAWLQILRRVPGAHLRIQNSNVSHPGVAARLRGFFTAGGIEAGRLSFGGAVPEAEYLRDIGETDIALEPFPQTGGVTAFDALWMGVPTMIHVVDDRPCCRAALLPASAAGIGSMVSATVPDYIDTAVMLAGQPDFLRSLRFSMRERLAAAPFTQPQVLARGLKTGLLAAWEHACNGRRDAMWVD